MSGIGTIRGEVCTSPPSRALAVWQLWQLWPVFTLAVRPGHGQHTQYAGSDTQSMRDAPGHGQGIG